MSEFDQMSEWNRFQMHGMESCALVQIHGIPDLVSNKLTPTQVLSNLLTRNGIVNFEDGEIDVTMDVEPFWIMTQAMGSRSHGWVDKFVDWLEGKALGAVVKSPTRCNAGGSHNYVTVYIFMPNMKAIRAWARKNVRL